jgi:hypothetical protein
LVPLRICSAGAPGNGAVVVEPPAVTVGATVVAVEPLRLVVGASGRDVEPSSPATVDVTCASSSGAPDNPPPQATTANALTATNAKMRAARARTVMGDTPPQ